MNWIEFIFLYYFGYGYNIEKIIITGKRYVLRSCSVFGLLVCISLLPCVWFLLPLFFLCGSFVLPFFSFFYVTDYALVCCYGYWLLCAPVSCSVCFPMYLSPQFIYFLLYICVFFKIFKIWVFKYFPDINVYVLALIQWQFWKLEHFCLHNYTCYILHIVWMGLQEYIAAYIIQEGDPLQGLIIFGGP